MGARVANGSFSFTGCTDAAARQLLSDAVDLAPRDPVRVRGRQRRSTTAIGDDLDAGDMGAEQRPAVRADRRQRGLRRGHRPGRPPGHASRTTAPPRWTSARPGVDVLSDLGRGRPISRHDGHRRAASTSTGPWRPVVTWGRTTSAPFAGPDGAAIADSPARGLRPVHRQHRHLSRRSPFRSGPPGASSSFSRRIVLGAGDTAQVEILRNGAESPRRIRTRPPTTAAATSRRGPGRRPRHDGLAPRPAHGRRGPTRATASYVGNATLDCEPRKGEPDELPVPQRHLDGHAARRGRGRPAAGAQARADRGPAAYGARRPPATRSRRYGARPPAAGGSTWPARSRRCSGPVGDRGRSRHWSARARRARCLPALAGGARGQADHLQPRRAAALAAARRVRGRTRSP